jgi:translation initiation factor 2B subunit (eIF-2B alpha/beta/delta family)
MDRTVLSVLEVSKENLVRKFDSLLLDYREYQSFFRKEDGAKAKEKADMRYYSYLMDLLEVGPYEEGKFSLEYTSLDVRMKENRDARKRITEQIKDFKDKIKEFKREFQVNKF